MDNFPEHKTYQAQRLAAIEQDVAVLKAEVAALSKDARGFRSDLDRLVLMFIGDEDLGLVGMTERIKAIELAFKLRGRWLVAGLCLTGTTGVITLVVLVWQALG